MNEVKFQDMLTGKPIVDSTCVKCERLIPAGAPHGKNGQCISCALESTN